MINRDDYSIEVFNKIKEKKVKFKEELDSLLRKYKAEVEIIDVGASWHEEYRIFVTFPYYRPTDGSRVELPEVLGLNLGSYYSPDDDF